MDENFNFKEVLQFLALTLVNSGILIFTAYSVYCGGVLHAGQGWISPIFLNSGRWLVCRWTLITDEGYSITMRIESINLKPECELNSIVVCMSVSFKKIPIAMCRAFLQLKN